MMEFQTLIIVAAIVLPFLSVGGLIYTILRIRRRHARRVEMKKATEDLNQRLDALEIRNSELNGPGSKGSDTIDGSNN